MVILWFKIGDSKGPAFVGKAVKLGFWIKIGYLLFVPCGYKIQFCSLYAYSFLHVLLIRLLIAGEFSMLLCSKCVLFSCG